MNFLMEKLLMTLFIVSLKTKKFVKSAYSGKLNYRAKQFAPYLIGLLIIVWTAFVFFI